MSRASGCATWSTFRDKSPAAGRVKGAHPRPGCACCSGTKDPGLRGLSGVAGGLWSLPPPPASGANPRGEKAPELALAAHGVQTANRIKAVALGASGAPRLPCSPGQASGFTQPEGRLCDSHTSPGQASAAWRAGQGCGVLECLSNAGPWSPPTKKGLPFPSLPRTPTCVEA